MGKAKLLIECQSLRTNYDLGSLEKDNLMLYMLIFDGLWGFLSLALVQVQNFKFERENFVSLSFAQIMTSSTIGVEESPQ